MAAGCGEGRKGGWQGRKNDGGRGTGAAAETQRWSNRGEGTGWFKAADGTALETWLMCSDVKGSLPLAGSRSGKDEWLNARSDVPSLSNAESIIQVNVFI
jgi:hypothetical protein